MKLLSALLAIFVSSCTHSIQGKLVSTPSKYEIFKHAKLNISEIDNNKNSYIIDIKENGAFECNELETGKYYYLEALVPGFKSESLRIYFDKTTQIEIPVQKLERQIEVSSFSIQDLEKLDRGSGSAKLTPPK